MTRKFRKKQDGPRDKELQDRLCHEVAFERAIAAKFYHKTYVNLTHACIPSFIVP